MWEFKSPLLQLPHTNEDNLKYYTTKKKHIKTIQQFTQLKSEERRSIVRHLTGEQYNDVMKVMGEMPYIDFQVRSEVIDDENPTVYTAGAIVTVTVTLVRNNMNMLFGDKTIVDRHEADDPSLQAVQGDTEPAAEEEPKEEEQTKKPIWQKQQKKAKQGGKKGSRNQKPSNESTPAKKVEEKPQPAPAEGQEVASSKKPPPDTGDDSDLSDNEAECSDDDDDEQHSQGDKKGSSVEDDDTEWEKFQTRISKREKVLEGRSKQSHSVHWPFFPEDTQEYWWVYISDRKSHTLLTSPYHVTALVEEEEVQLKFTAPRWPNVYTFTVRLRSDSYLGFDQMHDIKLDVKEAPEVPTEHPQWEMLDDEEEEQEGDGSDISEFTTDEDVEDDHE